MHSALSDGIPKTGDYLSVIQSDEFLRMERFAADFLSRNNRSLRRYKLKWVDSPLHQWSRQWEYPYVFDRIRTCLKDREGARVLDAGSGVTFFPFYIAASFPSVEVCCSDYDRDLEGIYRSINEREERNVGFSWGDIKRLAYADGSFDAIYCISVLEHTTDYREILRELHRVSKPGAKLVVTFDLSLDGTCDISLERAAALLESMGEFFRPDSPGFQIASAAAAPDVFTTRTAGEIDQALLPWRFPELIYRMKYLLTGRRFTNWPPLLAVCGLTSTRLP